MQDNITKKPNRITTRMVLILVFVLALGILNPIYGTIGIGLIICICMTIMSNRPIRVPAAFSLLWLLLFGISYVLFGSFTASYIEYYLVAVLLSFFAGYFCGSMINGDMVRTTKTIIYVIIFAEAFHALLNSIVNSGTVRWQLVDVFRGLRSATGSAFINTFVFSLAFVFIFIEKRKVLKILGISAVVVSLYYSFILGTRTTYLVAAVVVFVDILLYFHEQLNFKKYSRLIIELVFIILVSCILYNRDTFSIRTMMEQSNLFVRFTEVGLDKSDQLRIDSISIGLQSLLEHPFGGQIERRYFHNMWLDAGRVGGIFPFIFLLFYSINNISNVFYLFRQKQIDIEYRYIILSINLGLLLNCFTEPVLEGIMESFLVFIFINGIVESDYIQYKHQAYNIKKVT